MSQFINKLEEAIICLLLTSMTLLVFVEVLLRFGFSTGIHWAQELTLLLSAWMVLFGASYGVKVGSHIGVDAAVKIMPPTVRRVVSLIASVLCLVYTGLFIFGSWGYLAKMHEIGIELEDIPVPRYVAHSILIFGMILLALRLMGVFWRIFTGEQDGFKITDEAKESMHLAEEAKKAMAKDGRAPDDETGEEGLS